MSGSGGRTTTSAAPLPATAEAMGGERLTSPCVIWNRGTITVKKLTYGVHYPGGKTTMAHRTAYEKACGPIPADLVVDHLCRNTLCVEPTHLEPVTNVENVLRGEGAPAKNARKTHCNWGHAFTPENTHMSPQNKRICKACRTQRWGVKARKARQ